jgi:uncharacterized coiled-coil protein SlyX
MPEPRRWTLSNKTVRGYLQLGRYTVIGEQVLNDGEVVEVVEVVAAAPVEARIAELEGALTVVKRTLEAEVLLGSEVQAEVESLRGHLQRLTDWGWGKDAPDDAIRDWKAALAALRARGQARPVGEGLNPTATP